MVRLVSASKILTYNLVENNDLLEACNEKYPTAAHYSKLLTGVMLFSSGARILLPGNHWQMATSMVDMKHQKPHNTDPTTYLPSLNSDHSPNMMY